MHITMSWSERSGLLFSCYASLGSLPSPPALLALPGPINTFREMSPPPSLQPPGFSRWSVRQESINNSQIQYVQREMRACGLQSRRPVFANPLYPPGSPTPCPQLLNMFISILMKRPGRDTGD